MDHLLEVDTDLASVAGSVQAASTTTARWGSSDPSMGRSASDISPKQQPAEVFKPTSSNSEVDLPPPEPPLVVSDISSHGPSLIVAVRHLFLLVLDLSLWLACGVTRTPRPVRHCKIFF